MANALPQAPERADARRRDDTAGSRDGGAQSESDGQGARNEAGVPGQDAAAAGPGPRDGQVMSPSDTAADAAGVEVREARDSAADPSAKDLLSAIDTIVVLCMENRSFDHYLGARSLIEGRPVDGLRADMKNVAASGREFFVNPMRTFAGQDPPHGWASCHRQWNDGAMDGFVREMGETGADEVMGYYVREQVPVLWGLADHFVTCDRWFASVLGPTWPNRLYLHGGTSLGLRENVPLAFGFTSVFEQLGDAGLTHANYFVDVPWAAGGYFKTSGNLPVDRFFQAAKSGTLPAFSLIDPGFFGPAANDDHPAHDVRLGQAFIASVYAALRASPQWDRCLFVVTYDEHGGFFDHVPPPEMPDARADFRRLGVRVPGLVAGGAVKRGATVSTLFDHVSVVATVARRFGLPELTARVRATNDLSSCIDPTLLGRPRPGPELPPAPAIDMRRLVEIDRMTRGQRPAQHAELWDLAQAGVIPSALDRRAEALAITRAWLGDGERLGAVRLK